MADDVAIANTSFYLFEKLNDARKGDFEQELCESQEFWGYTIRAHWQIALHYLCRVYDTHRNNHQDRDAFHLLRLVEEIDETKLSDAERKLRRDDLVFLQKEYPTQKKVPDLKVAKLRRMRNNLLAHSNFELIQSGLNVFLKKNPLDRSEIQHLIDEAFSILERWAPYHRASIPLKKLAQGRDDYLFVLKALRFALAGR